jgi:aspartate carbamoyltransferase catalytic subunit
MRHIIESQQFDRKTISQIFSLADRLKSKTGQPLKGKIMATLFYEPSTRTRFSFESAMHRLGGQVLTTENAKEFSSVSKGETLEDTIRVIGGYADVIVLRHDEIGASKRAALVSTVPIINAGDGAGQHPTQALLDLYTVQKEIGKLDGIHIAFVGDLLHGRTIRSLAYLLSKYRRVSITFVSPRALRVGSDIKDYLKKRGVTYTETEDLSTVIQTADVIYQTRIQKERFKNLKTYQRFKGYYRIDVAMAKQMKKGAIIMHPLPRVDEIAVEVDNLPQAVYFKQAAYGLLIRMALLQYIFQK